MKIKHLKEWLSTLSPKHDECEIVFRKVVTINENNMTAKDNAIHACGIDVDNFEAYLCDITTHRIIEENDL